MKIIENRKSKKIIVLILKQMQLIEKNLKANNLSAREVLVDNNLKDQIDIDPIKSFVYENNDLINLSNEKRKYIEDNHYLNYYNDVSTVIWNINNSKSITFINNADIIIKKESKKNISYEIKYNLISDYFKISLFTKKANILLELNNGTLIRKYNDIEVVENLHSNENLKKIKIDSRRNNISKNVNATYRINLFNNEVEDFKYITRKGKKYDILDNITKQDDALNLLKDYTNDIPKENMDDDVAINYILLACDEILKSISDMSNDLNIIPSMDKKIDNIINQIRSHENMNIKKLTM